MAGETQKFVIQVPADEHAAFHDYARSRAMTMREIVHNALQLEMLTGRAADQGWFPVLISPDGQQELHIILPQNPTPKF